MLSWTPIEPFGAVVDLDINAPRDAATEEALRQLFDRHHLLVFRDQAVSHPDQIAFVSIFGKPLLSEQDGVGFISNEPGMGGLGDVELAFHSDLSFSPKPFDAICLHAVDVEDGRSSTRYIDSAMAYRRLPEALKGRIDAYNAMHVFGQSLSGRNTEDLPRDLPRSIHPLVLRHPRTGEKILYVNYNQTARIVELSREDSDALIEDLFACSYRPEAVYEHYWRMGDLVIWDNLAVQHARGDVSGVGKRTLQRVVAAEAGFFEQHPEFRVEQFMTR